MWHWCFLDLGYAHRFLCHTGQWPLIDPESPIVHPFSCTPDRISETNWRSETRVYGRFHQCTNILPRFASPVRRLDGFEVGKHLCCERSRHTVPSSKRHQRPVPDLRLSPIAGGMSTENTVRFLVDTGMLHKEWYSHALPCKYCTHAFIPVFFTPTLRVGFYPHKRTLAGCCACAIGGAWRSS